MSDNDTLPHRHFYITPDILPKSDSSDTQWIQQVTMLAEMSEYAARTIFDYLNANAPVLLVQDQPLFHWLSGLGLLLRGIQVTGRAWQEKHGVQPLDAEEEQARLIRDELANPNLPADLREALLTILAHNLEASREGPKVKSPEADAEEWPAEGVVIGEDSEN